MKKLFLALSTTLALLLSTSVLAFNPPEIGLTTSNNSTVITVYGDDTVTVKEVKGNNGACNITVGINRVAMMQGKPYKRRMPMIIARGTKWAFYSNNNSCYLHTVTLVTNHGDYEYDFN